MLAHAVAVSKTQLSPPGIMALAHLCTKATLVLAVLAMDKHDEGFCRGWNAVHTLSTASTAREFSGGHGVASPHA